MTGDRPIPRPLPRRPMPVRPAPLAALAALALALAAPAALGQTPGPQAGPLYPDLSGAALRDALRRDYAPTRTLGYGPARDSLYAYRQRTAGAVCGVYTGFCVTLTPGVDPSTSAFQQGVNAEHAWPQSRGAADEPQRSDLHALFPARATVNSARGNHPYAEVPDDQATAWYRLADSQSHTPTVALDEWSERADGYPGTGTADGPTYAARFEPRESAAGDVARAVAYFAAVHEAAVGAAGERQFLTTMLADLRAWNAQDPPDDAERAASAWTAGLQGTGNPFVADPTLLDRAFDDGYGAAPGGPAPGDPAPGDPGGGRTADGPLWVNEVHYDNAGADAGEFVEVAGPAGTALAGWRLVLYNGNGGAVYDDRPLAGTVPDERAGLGAVAVSYPADGLQNGPDGLALVDPAGAVVQFVSWEGVFNAVDGPAAGLVSTDLGVEESGATPAGHGLGLVGAGRRRADFAWAGPGPASPGALNAGQSAATATTAGGGPPPPALTLGPPVPNPSAGVVRFALALSSPAHVRAVVLDALGREVAVAHDGPAPGAALAVDAGALAPGVYVLRVTAASGTAARPFTVAR